MTRKKINPDDLIDAIRHCGESPRTYSGRGMYGDQCVGVTVDGDGEGYDLFARLRESDYELESLPPPSTDSMGLSIIIYWPSVKLPEGHCLFDEEDA